MNRVEAYKLGLLAGLADAVQDLDETYLYLLIPLSAFGCTKTDYVFGAILTAAKICSFFIKPCSGWLVDATEQWQHWTVLVTSVLATLSAAVMMFFGQDIPMLPLVTALYVFEQFVLVANETSIWKVIKQRCEAAFPAASNSEAQVHENDKYTPSVSAQQQQKQISWIGVIAEVSSNTYETVALAACLGCAHFGDSFFWTRALMIGSIVGGNAIILVLCVSIFPASSSLSSLLSLFQRKDAEHKKALLASYRHRRSTTYTIQQVEEGRTKDEEQEEAEDEVARQEKEVKQDDGKCKHNSEFYRFASAVFLFFKERLVAFFTSGLALHVILISWLLYTFSETVEYPVTFAISQSDVECKAGDTTDACTADNFCHGTIRNLLEATALEELTYVGGAVLYFLFLLKCPPGLYFVSVLPALSVVLIGVVASLWLVDYFPPHLPFVLTSIALVLPTFLEKYIFYFWTAKVESEYFGFFYGTYGFGENVLHIASSLLLAVMGDNMRPGSPMFSGLLAINIGMMIIVVLYCWWLYHRHKRGYLSR
ncbi:hypothetical protein QOT17_015866 [Balamuthia mandrillaris]